MNEEQIIENIRKLVKMKKSCELEYFKLLFARLLIVGGIITTPISLEKIWKINEIINGLICTTAITVSSGSIFKIFNSKSLKYYINRHAICEKQIVENVNNLSIKDAYIIDGLDENQIKKEIKRDLKYF